MSAVADDDVFEAREEDDFCHIRMEITCINEGVAQRLLEDLPPNPHSHG